MPRNNTCISRAAQGIDCRKAASVRLKHKITMEIVVFFFFIRCTTRLDDFRSHDDITSPDVNTSTVLIHFDVVYI